MDAWKKSCIDLLSRNSNPNVKLTVAQTKFIETFDRFVAEENEKFLKKEVEKGRVICSLDEFDEWHDEIEKVTKSEDDLKLEKLELNLQECESVLERVNNVLTHLDDLQKLYDLCSDKTNNLHEACESIIQQQHATIVAVETISEKIGYFTDLEQMSIKLGNPSPLILTDSLRPTLVRLDECVAFMETKPNYKESAQYLQQFKHLQSQALVTVSSHVQTTIQHTAKTVMPDSNDPLSPGDSVFTLFYGKFQQNSHRIKSLMALIEERIHYDEKYSQLHRDCQIAFFDVREKLIGPVLSVAIEDMVNSHQRNYCSLVRNSSRMLMHICRDEYQLFFQFFSKIGEDDDESRELLLHGFLENLCLRLYNVLRPIVIHLNHFETLSELCLIIKNEVIDDFVANHADELQSFGSVLEQLLQDIQERLVYRSNVYVQENIEGYNPAPGDLAYPEKLAMMENIAECLLANSSGNMSRSASVASIASMALSDVSLVTTDRNWDTRLAPVASSPADIHGMWFPTVRRTILCLTKLYRALDKPTFQGLSQDVVAACLISLEDASGKISNRKTVLDGHLFLIKHLLIVREQIAPFHIECTFREVNVDFNRVKTAALDLIQKRDNLFSLTTNNGLLRFLFEFPGATSVVEEIFDPQKIVDARIKRVCEQFIQAASEHLASTLIRFVTMARSAERIRPNHLRSQSFASVENVKESAKQMTEQLKGNLPLLKRNMSLYLANHDTETILFRPVKNMVCKHFDELIKLVAVNYTADDKASIACPSKEDIEMQMSL